MSRMTPTAILLLVCSIGCSSMPEVAPPKFNASKIADEAMNLLDTNSDGKIDKAELEASPGILAGMKSIDSDSDGQISREELENRFLQLVDSQVGAIVVECRFSKNSKPITGAEVKFTPEPFLEGTIVEATGKTDARGVAALTHHSTKVGAQPGFYRVSIDDGSLPAKYNTKTELGAEVSGQAAGVQTGVYEFKLK